MVKFENAESISSTGQLSDPKLPLPLGNDRRIGCSRCLMALNGVRLWVQRRRLTGTACMYAKSKLHFCIISGYIHYLRAQTNDLRLDELTRYAADENLSGLFPMAYSLSEQLAHVLHASSPRYMPFIISKLRKVDKYSPMVIARNRWTHQM